MSYKIINLAVAGSGKTYNIRKHIESLVQNGVDPSQIYCCTFTKKMAADLKEKLPGMQNIDTIHGMCFRIVSKHFKEIGYSRATMIDEDMETSIIKEVLSDTGQKKKITQKGVRENISNHLRGNLILDRNMLNIVNIYLDKMKNYGYFSYDMCELFAKIICEKINIKVQHLIVDEFQDSSSTEYDIVMALGENVYVAGDKMQSIYSFRGANPAVVDEFIKTSTQVIDSSKSYRCSGNICKAANVVIKEASPNSSMMTSNGSDGPKVEFYNMYETQIDVIIKKCLKFYKPEEIFVLTRTNATIEYLVDNLEGIPIDKEYTYVSRSNVFSKLNSIFSAYVNGFPRPEIMHILRLLKTPDSEIFDMDKTSRGNLYNLVKDFPIIKNIVGTIKNENTSFKQKCELLLMFLESFPGEYERYNKRMLDYITAENMDEYLEWYWNKSSSDFIATGCIPLLTAHSSKGLQNECIIVTELEDGKFPNKRGDYNEELRLLYVALTRAKKHLFIHHGNSKIIDKIKEGINELSN